MIDVLHPTWLYLSYLVSNFDSFWISQLKLDKYIPSISLIDDVIRYKWASLRVAGYAAITLWLMYAGFLYLFEYHDNVNDLDDPVPTYGCFEDCSMMDRFRNYFDSIYYTGVHLTGGKTFSCVRSRKLSHGRSLLIKHEQL